jgi:anti-sigma factor ChrR (cupin superfamily)
MYELKRLPQAAGWTALDFPGVEIQVLHTNSADGSSTVLTRLAPGATIPRHQHTHAYETVYVVAGDFIEDNQSFGPGFFLRARPAPPTARTAQPAAARCSHIFQPR